MSRNRTSANAPLPMTAAVEFLEQVSAAFKTLQIEAGREAATCAIAPSG
jgi:hypothetical protein